MNNDPYEKVGLLAERLRQMDRHEDADALVQAMAAGSTGTEIFMMLRWQLARLLAGMLPADLRAEATDLHAVFDSALR